MRRLRNVILIAVGFAVGWWIIARLLEWMSPKPVPAEGMQRADVHPYEVTPGISPTVSPEEVEDGTQEEDEPTRERVETDVSEDGGPSDEDEDAPVVYCLRCREKRPITDWHYETTDNGRRRIVGVCAVCGGGVSQFVKSE